MGIVFAKTRHEYPSYGDLWRLAEISGFEISTIDAVDPDAFCVYIVTPMNGEVMELLPKWRTPAERRATIIWWFLERLDSTPMLEDGSFDRLRPHFDQVWVSDKHMASQHTALRHVVLGSHPELGNDPMTPIYDWTHQSYEHGRRVAVYDRIRGMGLREGPNAWGHERDGVLRQSTVMLHVQQYPMPLYTPLRFAIAAAYAMPLVTETLADPFPIGSVIAQSNLDTIPETVARLAADPGELGYGLYQELCVNRTFRSEIERSL